MNVPTYRVCESCGVSLPFTVRAACGRHRVCRLCTQPRGADARTTAPRGQTWLEEVRCPLCGKAGLSDDSGSDDADVDIRGNNEQSDSLLERQTEAFSSFQTGHKAKPSSQTGYQAKSLRQTGYQAKSSSQTGQFFRARSQSGKRERRRRDTVSRLVRRGIFGLESDEEDSPPPTIESPQPSCSYHFQSGNSHHVQSSSSQHKSEYDDNESIEALPGTPVDCGTVDVQTLFSDEVQETIFPPGTPEIRLFQQNEDETDNLFEGEQPLISDSRMMILSVRSSESSPELFVLPESDSETPRAWSEVPRFCLKTSPGHTFLSISDSDSEEEVIIKRSQTANVVELEPMDLNLDLSAITGDPPRRHQNRRRRPYRPYFAGDYPPFKTEAAGDQSKVASSSQTADRSELFNRSDRKSEKSQVSRRSEKSEISRRSEKSAGSRRSKKSQSSRSDGLTDCSEDGYSEEASNYSEEESFYSETSTARSMMVTSNDDTDWASETSYSERGSKKVSGRSCMPCKSFQNDVIMSDTRDSDDSDRFWNPARY